MSNRIKVRDGVELEHHDDCEVTVWLTPYKGGGIGPIGVRLTTSEKAALIDGLSWSPNTRPGEIGDEDG